MLFIATGGCYWCCDFIVVVSANVFVDVVGVCCFMVVVAVVN